MLSQVGRPEQRFVHRQGVGLNILELGLQFPKPLIDVGKFLKDRVGFKIVVTSMAGDPIIFLPVP